MGIIYSRIFIMCKTVTRMADDVNAWDLYGNMIKLICEDYLIHNTHRTFRAWLLPFSFIIGQQP